MRDVSKRRFGPFSVDVGERELRREGEPVPLTPKAFDLLAAFVEQPGRLLSKEELLQKVWPDTFVEESNLAYNVFALRKALGDTAGNAQYIETVPKTGYRFTASITQVDVRNGGRLPTAEVAETNGAVLTRESHFSSLTKVLTKRPESAYHLGDTASESAILPFREDPVPVQQTMPDSAVAPEDAGLESSPAQIAGPVRWFFFSSPSTLLALVPVLAVVYIAARASRPSTDADPPRALPLTSLPGVVRSPSLSPDGNYVAFTWTGPKQDNPDVYVQQIGAGSQHQLTSDPSNDFSPSWSPDGRTIAFLRRGPAAAKTELWRIAPLGGPERKVAEIQPGLPFFRPMSLTWCPDSSCVLVTDSSGAGKSDAVFLVALETGEKRQLTFPQGLATDADAAVSPDGRTLIFRRDSTPFSGQFYRLSLKGQLIPDGEPVRLTSPISAGKPAWMPDNRHILFGARGALWRLDTTGDGSPTRLPFVGQDGQAPVVARTADGRQRLVYLRSFADSNVWRIDLPPAAALASSPPTAAVDSTRAEFIASLSPDGRQLAFVSDRSGAPQIWVAGIDGADAFPLTALTFASGPGFPRWSPDGQLIAFHADPGGRPDILVVPARGGRPTNLTKNAQSGGFPSFSRDGQWIYFASGLDGQSRIWKMSVSGGTAVPVTNSPGEIAIESYSGRDLYYIDAVDRPGSVWRQPLATGPPVKVLDNVVLGNFDVVESGIYYIDRSDAGGFYTDRLRSETRLRYFDFGTHRSTTIADQLGTVGPGLSASRDGRRVFFSRVDSSIDELMVVDNFR